MVVVASPRADHNATVPDTSLVGRDPIFGNSRTDQHPNQPAGSGSCTGASQRYGHRPATTSPIPGMATDVPTANTAAGAAPLPLQ